METPLQRLENRFPHTGFSGSADKEMQEELGPAYGIALGRIPPALCFIRMNVLSGAMERARWLVTISLAWACRTVTQAGTLTRCLKTLQRDAAGLSWRNQHFGQRATRALGQPPKWEATPGHPVKP